MQLLIEALNKMYSPRYCAADVTSKDGANLQIIWSLHLSKGGAKPQQEYSPRYCAVDVTNEDGVKLQIILRVYI